MRSRLLISVSVAALMAGAGLASAQDKGPTAAPQSTSPAQQSAPQAQPGAGGMTQPGGSGMRDGNDVQQRQEAPPARAQQDMDRGDRKQRAQDQREQRKDRQDRAQDKSKSGATASDAKSDNKSDKKGGATTGQGAAGSGNASLTSEQRSKISTNIRRTNVKRERNVNFNISVGTAIPRTITLHALPPTVVQVYPQWRGYRFVLVEDEIIIIEPGTYRIVAVIDA
jgi:hypothetical protein